MVRATLTMVVQPPEMLNSNKLCPFATDVSFLICIIGQQ